MSIYKRSAITAKEGVNFVRSTVEDCGSLFIKIEQESDLGVDAIIEFIKDGHPLNRQVAAQIKSGVSYYKSRTAECVFQIGDHRTYWSKNPLPVWGIVYVPTLRTAYWLNLKRFLAANPNATAVRFSATEANRFDSDAFAKFILPTVAGEVPLLGVDEAFRLARSDKAAETVTGLLVLFRRHVNNTKAWDEFVNAFRSRPIEDIPPILIYWLAHIPGHDDVFYFGESISEQTRAYARKLLSIFDVRDVVKLLSFIDPETQISRGALGQSVEAIVSSLPRASLMLRQIIRDPELEMLLREFAALILAMNEGVNAIPELTVLENEGSRYAGELANYIREYGGINPYA